MAPAAPQPAVVLIACPAPRCCTACTPRCVPVPSALLWLAAPHLGLPPSVSPCLRAAAICSCLPVPTPHPRSTSFPPGPPFIACTLCPSVLLYMIKPCSHPSNPAAHAPRPAMAAISALCHICCKDWRKTLLRCCVAPGRSHVALNNLHPAGANSCPHLVSAARHLVSPVFSSGGRRAGACRAAASGQAMPFCMGRNLAARQSLRLPQQNHGDASFGASAHAAGAQHAGGVLGCLLSIC